MSRARTDRAAARAARIAPARDRVAAARTRLVAEAAAVANGTPLPHDRDAAAVVRADAIARGIDLDDPTTAATIRAALVDQILDAMTP